MGPSHFGLPLASNANPSALPFLCKAVTRVDLARAVLVALMDTNVQACACIAAELALADRRPSMRSSAIALPLSPSARCRQGVQRFADIEGLSDRLGKFADRLECAAAMLDEPLSQANASEAPSGWAGFRRLAEYALQMQAPASASTSAAAQRGWDGAATAALTGERAGRALVEAAATAGGGWECKRAIGQEAWFAEWRQRLEGWWLALPLFEQVGYPAEWPLGIHNSPRDWPYGTESP